MAMAETACKPIGMAKPMKIPMATAREIFSGLPGCMSSLRKYFLIFFLLKRSEIFIANKTLVG
jgi:hypothetical protein